MEGKWHRVSPLCPQCSKEPAIMSFSMASDGSVLLEMVCMFCGVKLAWKSDVVRLICGAFNADRDEDAKKHTLQTPLRPPLADPCEIIADNAFLHSLGIEPNEPKRLQ